MRLKQNFPKAPLVPDYTPGLSPAHEAGPGYRARAVSTLLGVSRHKQKQAETSRFEQISPKLGRILPGALQRSAVPPPAYHRAGWAARRCPRPLGPRPHNTPHNSPPSYGGKRENGKTGRCVVQGSGRATNPAGVNPGPRGRLWLHRLALSVIRMNKQHEAENEQI